MSVSLQKKTIYSTYAARLVHLGKGEIHECITVVQVPVERLAVLEFDQDGLAFGSIEQRQW